MIPRSLLSVQKQSVGATAYPLDSIRDDQMRVWRSSTQWPLPTWQWGASKDGHRVIDLTVFSANNVNSGYITFDLPQRIKRVVMKRTTAGYSELGVIGNLGSNGESIYNTANIYGGQAANTWYTLNIPTVQSSNKFILALNNGGVPCVFSFYLIDEIAG